MSTIVFFCIPAYGHTNPTLGVVRELAARGHKVVYYSYDTMRKPIEAAGAAFVSCNAYDAEQRLSPKDGERLGRDLAFSTQVLVDTTLALDNAILSDMRALAPDCIVADSMALWGKLIAKKLDIPFVSSTTTFAFNRYSAKIMKQSPAQLFGMLVSMPKIGREIKRLQAAGYQVKSVLDEIPGVGPARRKALMKSFPSIYEIRDATAEQIAMQADLPMSVAEEIYEFFHNHQEEDCRE